jgi:hypothetical protein
MRKHVTISPANLGTNITSVSRPVLSSIPAEQLQD